MYSNIYYTDMKYSEGEIVVMTPFCYQALLGIISGIMNRLKYQNGIWVDTKANMLTH